MKKVLVVLATMAVILGFAATPAQASLGQCQDAHVCFWKDANFQGQFIEWVTEVNGSCWNVPASWNDVASSGWNTLSQDILLYKDSNCRSYFTIMTPDNGWSYFGGGGNDILSSFRYTIHCCGLTHPNYPSPDPNAKTLPEGGS